MDEPTPVEPVVETVEAEGAALDPFGRTFSLIETPSAHDAAEWNRLYLLHNRDGRAYQEIAALSAAIAAGWVIQPETSFETITDNRTKVTRDVYRFDGISIEELTPAESSYYGTTILQFFDFIRRVPKA